MSAPNQPRSVKVLIADDERDIGDQLKYYFEMRNKTQKEYQFDVAACYTIEECVSALRAGDYDVLVLDVVFRDGDRRGLELAMVIRHELRMKTPICILVSGRATLADCIEAVRAGIWDYLVKSSKAERLFEDQVVDSAVRGLRELDIQKRLEKLVVKEWLPANLDELKRTYPGQLIALWHEPTVTVVGSGKDAYELSDALRPWQASGPHGGRPYFYRVPR